MNDDFRVRGTAHIETTPYLKSTKQVSNTSSKSKVGPPQYSQPTKLLGNLKSQASSAADLKRSNNRYETSRHHFWPAGRQ